MKFLFGLIGTLFIITAQAQENTCPAAKTGNPCSHSSRAPSLNLGAGNPIHLMSGNKFQAEHDMLMRLSGLEVTRYYNSMASTASPYGAGWNISYNTRLFQFPHSWQILMDDGQRIDFHPPNGSPQTKAQIASYGHLQQNTQQHWEWHTPEGTIRTFNSKGLMIKLAIKGFPDIHIEHTQSKSQSLISRVYTQDEELTFHYQQAEDLLLSHITTPVGTIYYHYQKPEQGLYHQLDKVQRADHWERKYLYEPEFQAGDPYRLTGIVMFTPEKQFLRLNEWHYQEDGKAIYSRSSYPAQHRLSIYYQQEALKNNDRSITIITDEKGRQTQIHGLMRNGQYLLEKVTGHGCHLCPPVGTNAQYDDKGQLSLLNGFSIHRDDAQRINKIEFEHPTWNKVSIQYDHHGYVKNWHTPYTGTQPPGPHKLIRYYLEEPPEENEFVTFKDNQLVYKNGLILKHLSPDESVQILSLEKNNSPIWEQHRIYWDPRLLQQELIHFVDKDISLDYEYLYDDQQRLIAAKQFHLPSEQETLFYYAWHKDGTSKGVAINGKTITPNIQRDKQGLPTQIDHRKVIYGESKRIEKVLENGKTIATYTYDKHGRRTTKETMQGRTLFHYQGNRLSREEYYPHKTNSPQHKQSKVAYTQRHYAYRGLMLVGFIEQQYDKSHQLIRTENFYVHNDHLGQPFLISDAQQQIRWRAYYSPMGKATIITEDISFNIRQPGQYYDAETGWHDNYFRTYDPTAGHYFEPDPLGPIAGNDPYGYAAQQPRQAIDPLGLLLFAFDGTTNNIKSNTNVWKFYQLYDGDKFYKEGPGGIPGESWKDKWGGALFSTTTHIILDEHKRNLINYMSTKNNNFTDVTPIDIVGFSRGAAIGMIFANYVKSLVNDGLFHYSERYIQNGLEYIRDIRTCVDLRFIGLFDTVAQFGANGFHNNRFDYSAAPEWELITHAAAMNEYRYLLPLTTYHDKDNVIEQGFLGNHSDSGGVHVPDDLNDKNNPLKTHFGDLSHIPLAWSYTQAQQLGLPLKPLSEVATVLNSRLDLVQNPVMHNTYGEYYYSYYHNREDGLNDRKIRTLDRHLQAPNQTKRAFLQGQSEHLGDSTRQEHTKAAEVEFLSTQERQLSVADVAIYGKLDAQKYLNWLETQLNWTAPLKVVE